MAFTGWAADENVFTNGPRPVSDSIIGSRNPHILQRESFLGAKRPATRFSFASERRADNEVANAFNDDKKQFTQQRLRQSSIKGDQKSEITFNNSYECES